MSFIIPRETTAKIKREDVAKKPTEEIKQKPKNNQIIQKKLGRTKEHSTDRTNEINNQDGRLNLCKQLRNSLIR